MGKGRALGRGLHQLWQRSFLLLDRGTAGVGRAADPAGRPQGRGDCGRDPRSGLSPRAAPQPPPATVRPGAQPACAEEKALVLQTPVLRCTFLHSALWDREKQFSQFLGLSFSFCLTKTGHPSVPPAYSYTHRYNKISLNIKEKNTKIHGINVHFKPRLKYPHDDNNDNNYTDNNHNN